MIMCVPKKIKDNDTIIINISKSTGQIESVNKLTAFETRALAQGKDDNEMGDGE